MRVHPLFRFQHSRKNTARSPAVAALHGVPRWPTVNENHLRPCPMLENPELLREMIAKVGGFPFYKRPKTLHRPKTVSQIPKGFILLKKGLCKTQSPFSLSKKSAINADFFDRLKFVLFPIRFAKAF